jgi:hypothetical protein
MGRHIAHHEGELATGVRYRCGALSLIRAAERAPQYAQRSPA